MFWPGIRDFYYLNVRSKSNGTIPRKFAVISIKDRKNEAYNFKPQPMKSGRQRRAPALLRLVETGNGGYPGARR